MITQSAVNGFLYPECHIFLNKSVTVTENFFNLIRWPVALYLLNISLIKYLYVFVTESKSSPNLPNDF